MRHVRDVLSSPEQLPLALERRIVAFCFRRRCFALLHFFLSDGMTARLPRLAFAFRYHLLWMLRLEAMKEWQPSPIAVPTIVFSSGDALPGQTPDLGWGGLCAPLRIAPIGGTHASILQPPQLERLCARLLSALRVGGDIAPRVEAANDAQAASPTELPDLVRATELGRAFAPRSA